MLKQEYSNILADKNDGKVTITEQIEATKNLSQRWFEKNIPDPPKPAKENLNPEKEK